MTLISLTCGQDRTSDVRRSLRRKSNKENDIEYVIRLKMPRKGNRKTLNSIPEIGNTAAMPLTKIDENTKSKSKSRKALSEASVKSNKDVSNSDVKVSQPKNFDKNTCKSKKEESDYRQMYINTKLVLSTCQPDELIGRTDQLREIKEFLLHSSVHDRRSLYISGAPGTGKTACLNFLLKSLKIDSKVVFINCMTLSRTAHVYKSIYDSLFSHHLPKSGNRSSDGKSESDLKNDIENHLTGKGKGGGKTKSHDEGGIILVLDEIDQLECKDQHVLYTIFEWPYLTHSRLSLIGIANSLDMANKSLPRLKMSNYMPHQLCYASYTRDEIYEIVWKRILTSCGPQSIELSNVSKVDSSKAKDSPHHPFIKCRAIKFLAVRMCSQSGDIRRALNICHRAVELAEGRYLQNQRVDVKKKGLEEVDVAQMQQVFEEINKAQLMSSSGKPLIPSPSGADVEKLDSSFSPGVYDENPNLLPIQQSILVATVFTLSLSTSSHSNSFTSMSSFNNGIHITMAKLHETYSKICLKRNISPLSLCEVSSMCGLLEARGILALHKQKKKSSDASSFNVRQDKVSLLSNEIQIRSALIDRVLLNEIINDTSSGL